MKQNDDIVEQLANDPFVKLCWLYTCIKFAVLGIGTLGVFLYVVVSCLIDKL